MEPHKTGRVVPLWTLLGICLFSLALNVPFVNQAFHMDDGLYLLLAGNASRSPWFPDDVSAHFEGLHARDLASTEHPWPFTIYLLALCALVRHNVSEIGLHLAFLVFPIIIGCSTYFLARRFTNHPVLTTLLVQTGPVVVVVSHSLMTDVPMLSLWAASVAMFCCGIDARQHRLIWPSAVLVALACFLSYSGFCLIPLLWLYAALHDARKGALGVVALPLFAFAARLVWAFFHYHRFIPGMLLDAYFFSERVLSPQSVLQKGSYTILVLGFSALFPCLFIVVRHRRWIPVWVLVAAAAWLSASRSGHDMAQRAIFSVLFCSGLAVLFFPVRSVLKSRRILEEKNARSADDLFLGAWLLGAVLFCTIAYMNGSARYVLPAMPPLMLILVRLMECIQTKRSFFWSCIACSTCSAMLALVMAVSDYQFAGIYRSFSNTFQRSYGGRESNTWFTGEWGLRAYLERLGARELGRRDPRPSPGDLLVVPTLATPYETLFSTKLSLPAIILIAPSRMAFDVPEFADDSRLVFTFGMPLHANSDGMQYSIRFVSGQTTKILLEELIVPGEGRQWQSRQIPLSGLNGQPGRIVFSAELGKSPNAVADWIAFAHARICSAREDHEAACYVFSDKLHQAHIERMPGFQYRTDQNKPAFQMTVWLEQEPVVRLLQQYEYTPHWPVRLLDRECHAGFWSSGWGLLPLSWARGRSALETILVYEVIRSADAFGEVTPSWYRQ
jgi:hypothetical protein